MSSPSPTRRTITFRANRDTLVLLASAVTVTLALSYSLHRRVAAPPPEPQPARQEWAGRLAEMSPAPAPPAAPEPMSSESLVVPKSALALPPAQPAAPTRAATRAQPCEAPACAGKTGAPPAPTRQKVAGGDKNVTAPGAVGQPGPALTPPSPAPAPMRKKPGFAFSDLNPVPHLPDAVRRPFSYAGTKIAGWIDRF